MKYIYILEDDPKFRDEMIEAIQKIDSQLAIRWFDSLQLFAQWLNMAMLEGPAAIPKGGLALPFLADQNAFGNSHQLVLLICKNEILGSKNMGLLHKTREVFISRGLCSVQDPTSLVITSFENPDFDVKQVEDPIVNNLIFKPFDKLILQQHLAFAISGRHPPSQYAILNLKATNTIEMLKDVEIEALSDVGFVSLSNRPIAIGSVSKYYGPFFVSQKNHKSMNATCVHCSPHPDVKGFFRCAFSYVGADAYQITNLRKEARKKNAKPFQFSWIAKVAKTPVHVAIISGDEETRNHFKSSLEKYFSNIQVHGFPHLQTFLHAVDPETAKKNKAVDIASLPPVPKTFHAIFTEDSHFEGNFKEQWANILKTIKKTLKPPSENPSENAEIFLLAKKIYTEHERQDLFSTIRDLFFSPLDPMYLAKKMLIFMPQLNPAEELIFPTVYNKHSAKVANPIEISEFSEAGLIMKYYRPISLGAFRDFVLWLPHLVDLPEFPAACNYSEESKGEKGVYINHFVFFGMNDHFLKNLRRWILQNHVQSKESESA